MNNRIGGAFIVFSNNIEIYHQIFRLNNLATVYAAELIAIEKKQLISSSNDNLHTSNIISDSISVTGCRNNKYLERNVIYRKYLDSKILTIKDKINNFGAKFICSGSKPIWTPSGNERVDELAKLATNNITSHRNKPGATHHH
ncbi:hypothetical protein CEXT_722441 [Caerostris extrusa]|uniref:RNase H type-1 domain-containing protein n=1 Tax=Caerostris extrusa TaxID=172846 RepID=A0AAV4TPD2_CAEEX|nr:hypothetical protein CEXT_722441 [Caerostris extrusa]